MTKNSFVAEVTLKAFLVQELRHRKIFINVNNITLLKFRAIKDNAMSESWVYFFPFSLKNSDNTTHITTAIKHNNAHNTTKSNFVGQLIDYNRFDFLNLLGLQK